jgi:hypothetical protein
VRQEGLREKMSPTICPWWPTFYSQVLIPKVSRTSQNNTSICGPSSPHIAYEGHFRFKPQLGISTIL